MEKAKSKMFGDGTKVGRWSLGLIVAVVVLGAAALSGTVVGKQSTDPTGAGSTSDPLTQEATMSINWGSAGTSEGIEVMSWSWGETQSGSSHVGGGGGAGQVSFSDLAIVKPVDATSTRLMHACAAGTPLAKVDITFLQTDKKDIEMAYESMTLVNVIVSSYSFSGSGGSDSLPMEQVSFTFEKIHVAYSGADSSGNDTFEWDLGSNQA